MTAIMKENKFIVDHDFFSTEKKGETVLLRLKDTFLFSFTELRTRDIIVDYLDIVDQSESVKVLVIIGSTGKNGSDDYREFYRTYLEEKKDEHAICRFYNIIDQSILKIAGLRKITIHIDSGRVIPLFLNISLACDYRFVSEDTRYENPCPEFGMIPKGGGAFFLERKLGISLTHQPRRTNIVFSAYEAFHLGMVDSVVMSSKLESAPIEMAQNFCKKSYRSIAGLKRIMNYSMRGLKEYLSYEDEELLRIVGSTNFCEEIRQKMRS